MLQPIRYLILALLLVVLAGCATTSELATGAATTTPEPPTVTPEVFIARTLVAPAGPMIAGQVLWGTTPVAGAQVELRTGAWADPNASETIAMAVSGEDGRFEIEAPPAGGEFGLVALWPDGGGNFAPVTPVQVAAGNGRLEAPVYLARELALLEPADGAETSGTPTLRWSAAEGAASYRLWVMDAGTSELVFDLDMSEGLTETLTVTLPPLAAGRAYNWEAQGLDAAGNLLAGLRSRFATAEPAEGGEVVLPERCLAGGEQMYADPISTYCFVYPADFELQVAETGMPLLYGPALDQSLDSLRASLLLEVEVAIEGKTLAEIVDNYLAQFASLDVPAISRSRVELGGEPAELLEVVPGREGSRDLFALRNGTLYHLMFMPSVRDFPQAGPDVERLYATVLGSFSFVRPGSQG